MKQTYSHKYVLTSSINVWMIFILIEACGLEFRSDRLWESYIKWEAENGSALHVTNIYDRLLATPTLGYTSHFDK